MSTEVATELTDIERARELVLERVDPLGDEPVALERALWRILAEDLISADDVPGFDNSAMDGYALRSADVAAAGDGAPVALAIVAESRAGHPAERGPGPGEAVAISTGAVMPDGADAVVRLEDTDGGAARVRVTAAVEPGANVRRAGEDIRAGELVLAAGAEIGPATAGVIASVGVAEPACARRPRVSVITTGDELQEPGEPLRPGAIRNSNAYSAAGLVLAAGAELAGAAIVGDDRSRTRNALRDALGADVVVVCGGVSVGPHDHVRPALAELGVEEVFWRVALRPGKPTCFGVAPPRDGRRTLVFGLPGNPVSVVVTFLLFVRPAIRALLGAADAAAPRTTAVLDADCPKAPGRAHLVRCRLRLADDGWHATPTKEQGSHVLSSMLGADALAILPTDAGDLPAGARVEVELLPQ